MDHAHTSCIFHTRVLLYAMDLASMLPYTVRMLDICSYGALYYTCGTPNNFTLFLALILIELEGKILQILLQLLYS
jgi:hypothetical protein